MVKIKQVLPLLFIVISFITANQHLSSGLLCKVTQALGANIWDAVSERGVEILHSFIAPAAQFQFMLSYLPVTQKLAASAAGPPYLPRAGGYSMGQGACVAREALTGRFLTW